MSLHSTMFLLIPEFSRMSRKPGIFTFHYVSINTYEDRDRKGNPSGFTFHYVSINTKMIWFFSRIVFPLHSTMFLLIRHQIFDGLILFYDFTFHYVSINTVPGEELSVLPYIFTFHYVSINTFVLLWVLLRLQSLHSTMFLLIPAPLNHRLILPYYTIFCRPWYFFIFLFISI